MGERFALAQREYGAGISQSIQRRITCWTAEIRLPAGARDFCLLNSVQTGSEALPASYPMGTGVSFRGSKAAAAWNWPLTSIWCRGGHRSRLLCIRYQCDSGGKTCIPSFNLLHQKLLTWHRDTMIHSNDRPLTPLHFQEAVCDSYL
jgi:hypothetical protein